MLIKINNLEERLLETQLQLERVSDEKLIHMLSIQMCPTDKTWLRYVPPSTSDIPSTSQTIFGKLVIPESPPLSVDKGKNVMDGKVLVIPQPLAKLLIRKKPLTCHHCGKLGHIRPKCPHQQVQRKKKWQAPKTPMHHQCGVSSHIRPRCPPPRPPRHHRSPPRNHVPRHQQLQKPTQARKTWVPKKLYMGEQKTGGREISYEGTSSVSSFMQDLIGFLALQLKKEGQYKKEDIHPQGGADLPSTWGHTCLGFWFLNSRAWQVHLHSIFIASYEIFACCYGTIFSTFQSLYSPLFVLRKFCRY
jgi:hypothetical protein